jgi:starvation-inducible DNA-binding protein
VFARYLKPRNLHWRASGPHFHDWHLLFDELAGQLFAMTDPLTERVRKIGEMTIRSVAHSSRARRIGDTDAPYVGPLDMLAELREDNLTITGYFRQAHGLCEEHRDVACASLIETWIDETEKRTWFPYETAHCRDRVSH